VVCERPKWKLRSVKYLRSLQGFLGSNWGAEQSPRAGIGTIGEVMAKSAKNVRNRSGEIAKSRVK